MPRDAADHMADFLALRPGDRITVRYGRRGTQHAVVHRGPRKTVSPPSIRVQKWRAASRGWTAPVTVFPSEYIGRAGVAHA